MDVLRFVEPLVHVLDEFPGDDRHEDRALVLFVERGLVRLGDQRLLVLPIREHLLQLHHCLCHWWTDDLRLELEDLIAVSIAALSHNIPEQLEHPLRLGLHDSRMKGPLGIRAQARAELLRIDLDLTGGLMLALGLQEILEVILVFDSRLALCLDDL